MPSEAEVPDNCETSISEHQSDGKANAEPKNTEKETVDKETFEEKVDGRKGDTEIEKVRGIDGASLDNLLQKLPRCCSRDLVDQLAVRRDAIFCMSVHMRQLCPLILKLTYHFQVEFCYLNSKASRKKLAQALFSVPRTSLELLPYYSRLVATLSPYMKNLPSMLLSMLEEEFNFLINKKVRLY